ncbi:MAG: glycosyltransferase family 9 protein [Desulfobacterales bacterium]|nr:glycosyltransferase family 9 protein [Desulfobacterales bacterium]
MNNCQLKDNVNYSKKILIIARGGIGDFVFVIPAVERIKKTFPKYEIHILASNKEVVALLKDCHWCDQIIYLEETIKNMVRVIKRLIHLRNSRYAVSLVMVGGAIRSAIIPLVLGIKIRLGYDIPTILCLGKIVYTHSLKPEKKHRAILNLNLLKLLKWKWADYTTNLIRNISPDISLSAQKYLAQFKFIQNENLIGLQIGSSKNQKWKRWPSLYYKELIHIINSHWKVVFILFGNQSENQLIDSIIDRSDSDIKIIKITDQNIIDVEALISLCTVFIGNDSGLTHLAAANKVETFCLFGPTASWESYPYGSIDNAICSNKCRSCYHMNKLNIPFRCSNKIPYECLQSLDPAMVFEQMRHKLECLLNDNLKMEESKITYLQ